MSGSVWRRPDGCGLGQGLPDRADDITAARERSESLLRYSNGITRMRTMLRHGSRTGHGLSGGTESVR